MQLKVGNDKEVLLYFQHGWGFTSACWNEWLPDVQCSYKLLDRGYCSSPILPEISNKKNIRVLICHSLGLHMVQEINLDWVDMLVVMGGFIHLHGATERDGRFTRKHLQRMFRRLAKDPVGLVKDFHRDCQYAVPFEYNQLVIDLLTSDLDVLDKSILKSSPFENIPHVLLIHGEQDRIVPLGRAHELKSLMSGSELVVFKDGGHGLPFTHQEQILSLIHDKIFKSLRVSLK